MFSFRRVTMGRIPATALLLALGIVLGYGGFAQAAPQYTLTCISCHQMPPLDSGTATKNPVNGAVPGNHQRHASSAVSSCAKCHGAAVNTYATGHRNKAIELQGSLGYSRGFVNQTSVPPNPLGTCSAASCHSGSVTPAWGSAPFSAPADCAQCHAVAPATGSHPVSGSKHGNYLGTGTGSCVKCHADHVAEAKPFAHATSAGQRAIEVKFTSSPNTGGTFAGNQCSNTYCHSDGKSGAPNVIPAWGASLNCKGCHNSNLASGAAMNSGKHTAHVDNAGLIGTNYGCADCHAQTADTDTHIVSYAKHVNGFVNFSGARAGKNYNTVTKACSTVYCHSDGKGGYKNIAWNSPASLDCKSCHGSDAAPDFASAAGEPNYSNAGTAQPKANTHKTHVTGAADCASCHANTTTDGYSIKSGSTLHTNRTADVFNGNGKSFTYSNDATKTCSNVSCHSGGGIITGVSPAQWGASLGCTGCHGDAASLASNAHTKHVNPTTGKAYACDTCHNLTVSGSSTIVDQSKHGDSSVEVAGGSVSYTVATKTCATSCHLTSTPQWNNLASGACGTCHNALSTTVNGIIASNAHSTHFTAAYGPGFSGTTAVSCANCHTYTTDTAATHDNGTVELAAGFNKIGTCTNCHKQSTNWTTGRVACESCHTTTGGPLSVISGVTAPDKTLAATAGHGKAGIAQQCTACHDNNGAHISGTLGDNTRLTASLTGPANTECNFCHNDPGKVSASKLNMQVHVGIGSTCAACHDPHGTANSQMVRTTLDGTAVSFGGTDFVNGLGTGVCQACHTATAYYKKNVAENNHPSTNCLECHLHNAASGTAFEPNRACDSCHGYPPAPRVVNSAVTFGVQGNWSSARFEDYSGGGGAHVVAAHLAKSIKPSDGWTPCLACHSGGAATHAKAIPVRSHVENVTVKVDTQYRFSDGFIVYTSAKLVSGGSNKSGSCFNVSCHISTTPKWSIER